MASARKTFRDLFENEKSPSFTIANDVLALATILSVLALVLETVEGFSAYEQLFNVIEYGTVALFTAEYLGRLYAAKSKPAYIFSFFGIVDLLAILPTFIGLTNLTFLKTTRALRILRFLRILRIIKLARKGRGHPKEDAVFFMNVQIYAVALVTALLILGSLLYVLEGGQSYAKDLPSAMYWVFSIILGGLSYERPVTTTGSILLITCRFLGLIFLGLIVNLTRKMMQKLLTGSTKDNK